MPGSGMHHSGGSHHMSSGMHHSGGGNHAGSKGGLNQRSTTAKPNAGGQQASGNRNIQQDRSNVQNDRKAVQQDRQALAGAIQKIGRRSAIAQSRPQRNTPGPGVR